MLPLEKLADHLQTLQPEDYAPLFALMPIIESKTTFGEIALDENGNLISLMMPWQPDDVVREFVKIAYQLNLVTVFDWPAWRREFDACIADLRTSPQRLDAVLICQCFTTLIRADRFNDTVLINHFQNGTMLLLLRRLQQIVNGS